MDKPKQCVKCKYFKAEKSCDYLPNAVYVCFHLDMPVRNNACNDTDILYSNCPIKTDNDR